MDFAELQSNPLLKLDGGKPKLLVVDDQPLNIQVIYQHFASDYQVFMAVSGEQALKQVASNPPDLILLDIMMPGMDGMEVCRRLKSDSGTRDIPIIFVTANTDPDQETAGLELGAVDFISKPVHPAKCKARVRAHMQLKLQGDVLRKLVYLDGLSGVYNRRFFDQQLDLEMRRATRNGGNLSLILLDVDHFKKFNDLYGHQSGDDCLRRIAVCLRSGLRRPADLVARYGGEEFACILPETSFDEAMLLANALEHKVRGEAIAHLDSDTARVVTVSLGVATRSDAQPGQSQDLLALADAQLYQAKHSGRGRACGAMLWHAPV